MTQENTYFVTIKGANGRNKSLFTSVRFSALYYKPDDINDMIRNQISEDTGEDSECFDLLACNLVLTQKFGF